MKKRIFLSLFALVLCSMISVSATAQLATHSVWTNNNSYALFDPQIDCQYTDLAKFFMATSWTEPTPGYPAQAHFRGVSLAYGETRPCAYHEYAFSLNLSTATTNDAITGYWDVYRDGSLVCSLCPGSASGLSQLPGNLYFLIIDDPFLPTDWVYSGLVDQRKDF